MKPLAGTAPTTVTADPLPAKRRRARSRTPKLTPVETEYRSLGVGAKARLQGAFDHVVERADVESIVENVCRMAANPDHPLTMQATKWLFDRGVGPVGDDVNERVTVVTLLRFEDRTNGAPVAIQRSTAAQPRVLEAPQPIDIEV